MTTPESLSRQQSLEALAHAAREAELRSKSRTKRVVFLITAAALVVMIIWDLAVLWQWRVAVAQRDLAIYAKEAALRAEEAALQQKKEIEELYQRASKVTGIRATSPDRTTFVSDAGYLVNARNNNPITKLGEGEITAVQFSPDGRRIVVGSGNQILIYNLLGDLLAQGSLGSKPIHLSFSSDGMLVLAVLANRAIVLLDAKTGQEQVRFQMGERIQKAAFSPEGRRILTQTATGELSVWDLAKDRILVRIPAPNTETSNFVGFSMNGTQIIVGYASGQVFTWDAENGRPESRFLVFR
jgi:WD40 repeat protein